MTERPRKKFPSDHRRHVRVHEDLLDDPRLMAVDADVFRFFIRLLMMTNRAKSHSGELRLDRYGLMACAMRQQVRHALTIARAGAEAGLYDFQEHGVSMLFRIPNWLEDQGKPPPDLRPESDEPPPPDPVPDPVPDPLPTPVPGEESGPPSVRFLGSGIGKAEQRKAEAAAQIEIAIGLAPDEAPERREERRRRLEILSVMFLACGQVADEGTLRTYFRTTIDIPTDRLRGACDSAVRASKKGFPPPVAAVVTAWNQAAVARFDDFLRAEQSGSATTAAKRQGGSET